MSSLQPSLNRVAVRVLDEYDAVKNDPHPDDIAGLKVVKVYPVKNNPNYKKLINEYYPTTGR